MTPKSIILGAVIQACDIDPNLLFSDCRKTPIADARLIAAHHLREHGCTNRQIGETLNRVGSYISKALVRHDGLYDTDPVFRAKSIVAGEIIKNRIQQNQ